MPVGAHDPAVRGEPDRLRLMLVVVVVVVVALATAGGVVSWQRHRAEVETEDVRASSSAMGSARAIDQFLTGRLALLSSLADLPSVRSADWERMAPELGAMSAPGLGFEGDVGWVDTSGTLRSTADEDRPETAIDLSDRPYVAEVLTTAQPVVSEGLVGRRTGDPVVVLAAPTFTGTDLSGMLVASVRLADLDEVVIGLDMAGGVTVVDKTGHVVYQDGDAGSLAPVDPATDALIDRAGGESAVQEEGGQISAAATTPRFGWAVVYEPDASSTSVASVAFEWALLGALAVLVILSAVLAVISNGRWKARTRRRTADLVALDHLAEALARAEDTDAVAAAAAEEIRSAFDAALVLVTLADDKAGGLLSVAASGMRNRDLGVNPLLPYDTPTLMTDAFKTDGSLVVRVDDYVERYPHMANSIPDSRIVMAVGHRFLGPRAAGAISMSFADERPFGDDDDALLDRLTSMLPDAFARARTSDRERASSLTLQEALLPTDRVDGFDDWQRAARYRPASEEASIGGDWFDLFEVGPHRMAVAVGDIVGQGIHAAAVMGQLRSALRALARVSDSPERALEELDRFSREVDGAFASTALLAIVDTRARVLEIAVAGHPPPMLATPDGVVVLQEARGAPIGVAGAPPRRSARIELGEEQTIVFYTDGLVERRGEVIDDGLERLVQAIGEHRDEPLQRLVDLAIAASAEPSGRDDLAVVALRPVGSRPRTFSASIRSGPADIRAVRHDLHRWLDAVDPAGGRTDDLLLAVSEATTNARDHAYQGADDGEIVVTGQIRGNRIEVIVRDFGHWAPSVRSPVRGRGLSIMSAVTDELVVDPTPAGLEVRLVVVLEAAAAPEVSPRS